MKFRKDNKIPYWQDMQSRHGIPSGVDFTVVRTPGGACYQLRAFGYGMRGRPIREHYGNGVLHVELTLLKERQRKRFESEITEA